MVDLAYAKNLVEKQLDRPEHRVLGDTWVVCTEKTVHGEFGWMFFYTTKRFQETGNWRYEAPGNMPIIVDKIGNLYLVGTGAGVEQTIFAFVKDRKDFPQRSLMPFNYFHARARCTDCGSDPDIAFAAKIGLLTHQEFRIGDTVYPLFPVAPAPHLEGCDFLGHGVGICPVCRQALWAEIQVCHGRFHLLRVGQQPSDPEAWVRV